MPSRPLQHSADERDVRGSVTAPKFVGARVRRKEDPRLITGHATFAADVRPPGLAHAKILRSIQAHARIDRIDTAQAKRMPGVLSVMTGEDLGERLGPLPIRHDIEGLQSPPRYVLARDVTRHVGDALAVVVAETEAQATDALDTITVSYDPLPAVTDLVTAADPSAPRVHAHLATNVSFSKTTRAGDPDREFKNAAVVRSQRLVSQRLVPTAIEPRCVVAEYDRGYEKLTVTTSTQVPHLVRALLGHILQLPEHRVRVVAPEVGGGFGAKLNFYPEEPLLAYLSRELARPVKWTETRTEAFVATTHGRDSICDLEVAADATGRLLAIRATLYQDLGAYLQLSSPHIVSGTAAMITGCYAVEHLDVTLKGVFTNKTTTDAYRGAGRPEATYIIERAMDLIAHAVEADPVEVRRRNFVPVSSFPHTTATGLQYDSGDYAGALDKLLVNADYQKLRSQQTEARQSGRLFGIGLACYVEMCGFGPSAMMAAGGWESCEVEVRRTGKVIVRTGLKPTGQGEETAFAQMVADGLGVDLDDVDVVHGDTDIVGEGVGTFGSRGMVVGGSALARCVDIIREKACRIAGHLLEASASDIVFAEGRLYPRGAPALARPFQEIAEAALVASQLPASIEPGLFAVHYYEPTGLTFPFGAHLAVVEVDEDTGAVTLRRYVAVDDCGTMINPMLVEGQVHGGIAQGVGQALFEHGVYDENGQLVTGSLMDYAVPRARAFPRFELDHTVTPTPVNPLGAKGVGEAGTIGSTPAVVNAVMDALRPRGIEHLDMPLTPERVWRALHPVTP